MRDAEEVRALDLAPDEDGYLSMDGVSGDDRVEATGADLFLPPPPLADSDWLAAVSHALTASLDGMAADDAAGDQGTQDLVVGEATTAGAAVPTDLDETGTLAWTLLDGTGTTDVADAMTDDSW